MSELIIANKSDIVAIADAIREKTGQTGGITLDAMDDAIEGISGSGSSSGICTVTLESATEVVYVSTSGELVTANTTSFTTNIGSMFVMESHGSLFKLPNATSAKAIRIFNSNYMAVIPLISAITIEEDSAHSGGSVL